MNVKTGMSTVSAVSSPSLVSSLYIFQLLGWYVQLLTKCGLCPGMYLLSEKVNKAIHDLHDPVPHYHEMLAKSIERTLKRFQPDQPFERTSWNVTDDRNLFWRT